MYFNDKLCLLTDVKSKYSNPLHEDLIGRICRLNLFEPEKFGLFLAQFEDGWHRIGTSIVKQVSILEDGAVIELMTANSVYTFHQLAMETENDAEGNKDGDS